MKLVPLTQGQVAMVDDADYNTLSQYKWHATKNERGNYYARRYVGRAFDGRAYKISMQKEIMKPSPPMVVDHINHDTLDNRRQNLRVCTQQQNVWNSRKPKNNRSGYKGVYYLDGGLDYFNNPGIWVARIMVSGKIIYLGYFKDKLEAAKTYNKAAFKHFGQYACLNSISPEEAL